MNIVICLLISDFYKSDDFKKNDLLRLNILVDLDNKLICEEYDYSMDIKSFARKKVESVIGIDDFHLEQVYTFGESKYYNSDKSVDVLYLALINNKYVNNDLSNYKMIELGVSNNKINFGNEVFEYNTIKVGSHNNLEYIHKIKDVDLIKEKMLIEILTCYKYLKIRCDYSDIMFKLLPEYFTLEDVRVLYQSITSREVDKSNFRKKIIKYCIDTDKVVTNVGYRPTKLYSFKVLEEDIWL